MNDKDKMLIEEVTKFQGLSIFTAKLIEKLSKCSIGDVLTDEELSAACGRDTSVGGDGYGNLHSAIKYVRQHNNLVFERVRDSGSIKCLGYSEILNSATGDLKSIHKKAKTVIEKTNVIDTNQISGEEKRKLVTTQAQAGFLEILTRKRSQKKIEQILPETYKPDITKIKWE